MDTNAGTLSIEQKIREFEAMNQNMALLQGITQAMKEIPVLPSETAGVRADGKADINPLVKVEFPEQGGVLTYMENHEHPYKGFPVGESVEKIDAMKKMMRSVLSSLFHSFKKRSKFQLFFLLFVPWIFTDLVDAVLNTCYRMVDRFKIKTIRYSDAVREIHRSFSIEYYGIDNTKRFMVRDVMCMLLEMDNAYRFRFQDIIVELDKENLKKNTAKEIIRLFALMSSREKTQEVKDTWKLVQHFLPTYFRINKSFKQNVIDVLSGLDLQKIALSVEDKHYCENRMDYKFGYMNDTTWQTHSTSAEETLLETSSKVLAPQVP